MKAKRFSYEEARALVPDVREKTVHANEQVQELRARVESAKQDSARARKLNEWINMVINRWAEEIVALGALPKGLWTVDFDSGEGFYYCWSLNEDDLSYFHLYEEGFLGRKPLSEADEQRPPLLLN